MRIAINVHLRRVRRDLCQIPPSYVELAMRIRERVHGYAHYGYANEHMCMRVAYARPRVYACAPT